MDISFYVFKSNIWNIHWKFITVSWIDVYVRYAIHHRAFWDIICLGHGVVPLASCKACTMRSPYKMLTPGSAVFQFLYLYLTNQILSFPSWHHLLFGIRFYCCVLFIRYWFRGWSFFFFFFLHKNSNWESPCIVTEEVHSSTREVNKLVTSA